MKNITKWFVLIILSFLSFSFVFADGKFDEKINSIFHKLESRYTDKTVWIKNQEYKKIINVLEKYKTSSSNTTLNKLIDWINNKLEDTIYNYENKIDTWSCSETYNLFTISDWSWKCQCSIWYDWTMSDDGTMWCADYSLWSCIQELGFLSVYDSSTNSCGCQEWYFIWSRYGWNYCVSNSEHPMITQQGVFAPKLYFWWYLCTQDCSWHIAWYEWAKEKSIYNSLECWGNSQSFIEWCYVFTENNSY